MRFVEPHRLLLARDAPQEHPTEHPADVRVGEGDRIAVGEAGDRTCRVRADAGKRVQLRGGPRQAAGVASGDPVKVNLDLAYCRCN